MDRPILISHERAITMIFYAAFTVTAADLKPLHPINPLVKFADHTYLVVPSVNADSRKWTT